MCTTIEALAETRAIVEGDTVVLSTKAIEILREKYNEFGFGVPQSRQTDTSLRDKALSELEEEVNTAKPFFAPKPIEVADGAVPRDPAKSPDHKMKTKTLSARDRYRTGVRRSLNPEAPRVTTEVEQYKYMIDNGLFMFVADGEHVGQLWVRKDIKEKFPIIHIVAMAYLCIDPTRRRM
ncbi:hypothetical protein CYMTET_24071 [Cymbomonas tetramitiformis]|uniref:Uncharacterized protein n=1 Tax=Cymbomonas tetramitiformis TaxID=36881 RepID=A0AAE0FWL8_9CHLO|nr:hypothetical protein CYMTET_24071 [Cymbomonas tetramitiformis]